MENPGLTKEIIEVKDAYLAGRNITERQSALAAYSVLDEYRWLPNPSQPEVIQEYYRHGDDQRKKMNSRPDDYQGFWRNEEVIQYFESKHRVANINRTNLEWLKWLKIQLPEGDKATAIDLKIQQFSLAYREHQRMIAPRSEAEKQVVNMFGGRVLHGDD